MPADPPSNGPRLSIAFLSIGTEMVSFTLIGLLLDYVLGTMPWCTIGLTLLALPFVFFQLTRMAKVLGAKKGRPPGPAGGGAV